MCKQRQVPADHADFCTHQTSRLALCYPVDALDRSTRQLKVHSDLIITHSCSLSSSLSLSHRKNTGLPAGNIPARHGLLFCLEKVASHFNSGDAFLALI